MNLLQLLKLRDKQSKAAQEARNKIAVSVITNVDTSHGIARVISAKAHKAWDKQQEDLLVKSFKEHVTATGKAYPLLSKEDRLVVLRKTATDLQRSTTAVKIRLDSLNELPRRKDVTADDLKALVTA